MNLLVVGDPHATVEELADCERLIDYLLYIIENNKVDDVLFLGDLHHNHAVVRIEVMAFWHRAFARLNQELKASGRNKKIWALKGNHDMSHDANVLASALDAYGSQVEVVGMPQLLCENVLMVPYQHNVQDFLKAVGSEPHKLLFCHQSFNGAQFDNGFYDPGGVDPDALPSKSVISGHIHGPQEFGKVWYPGSPRWRTVSDADKDRAVWLLTIEDAEVVKREQFATHGHCRPIVSYVVREDDESTHNIVFATKGLERAGIDRQLSIIDVHGSRQFIDRCKTALDARKTPTRLRTFETKADAPKVRESDGIKLALVKFVGGWKSQHGTSPELLQELVAERVKYV